MRKVENKERAWDTITEMTRYFLDKAGLLAEFWKYITKFASYAEKIGLQPGIDKKPDEKTYGSKPNVSFMKKE